MSFGFVAFFELDRKRPLSESAQSQESHELLGFSAPLCGQRAAVRAVDHAGGVDLAGARACCIVDRILRLIVRSMLGGQWLRYPSQTLV